MCAMPLAKMHTVKRILARTALLLALADCSSMYQDEPIKPEPLPNQSSPVVGPEPQSVPPNLSPAARAAGATDSGELKDCVTDSCKINCSPKVQKRFRPKWCAYFKEPSG